MMLWGRTVAGEVAKWPSGLFMEMTAFHYAIYCGTHNVRICLYIAYIAYGYASLYVKTLHFFLTVLGLSAAATVANIKICYDAKTLQFALFGTRVICVFYSIRALQKYLRVGWITPFSDTPPPPPSPMIILGVRSTPQPEA